MASKIGLTTQEAKRQLEKHGPNILPEKPPPSDIKIIISQLKSPLVYILIFAALVTLILKHYSDTAIITFAVLINTVLGFLQERRANKSLHALKKLIHPKAVVVREGKRQTIDVENVVPGDICVLKTGEKIPADGKLIESNRLFITEAILTGESIPVAKAKDGKTFLGTIVTAGVGKMEVLVTGKDTEMGKIAQQVQEASEDTPLRRQLIKFSRQLTYLVAFLTTFVFVVGLIQGKERVEIFTTSVALSVSAIPEGLLVGLTVVLAIGMQRILKRKGLVRNLVSAETLGGVTTICVDKTGTLTAGKMQVVEVVGEERDIAKQGVIANDLDDPIVVALWEWSSKHLTNTDLKGSNVDEYVKKHTRIDSIPFTSEERFFASLNKVGANKKVIFVNGAPEFLLEWSDLNAADKANITRQMNEMTAKGMRVMGLARKEVSLQTDKLQDSLVKNNLTWGGLIGFSDPVRRGVADALAKTKKAGINTLVITGDYAQTAITVMTEIGESISDNQIMLGSELKNINQKTLVEKLKGENAIKLFARTTPQQKLKIVEALKSNREVVAMMGDGVNDAPALKRADIGIVVGEASDVAKETADLVLLDSNFATIIAAIEEGRGIFDNLRKIILYLMSDAFSEIVAVIGSIILGLPLPVTAAQILWINLVSDGLPDLALTVDPKTPGNMSKPPRSSSEPLLSKWMKIVIGIVSLVGGIIGLMFFIFYYLRTGDEVYARSVSFIALGVNSLIYVFSVRTLNEPFWNVNPLKNKWLNFAVLSGLILQFIPFLNSTTRNFFGVVFPGYVPLIFISGAGIIMFIIIELSKAAFSEQLKN